MIFQWSDRLSVGVEEIDIQHKELFNIINKLLDTQSQDSEPVESVFGFLEKYVEVHFALEENYMERFNYPEIHRHEEEHTVFWENFAEIRADFNEEGITGEVADKIQDQLCDWLVKHILKIDMELGVFLKTKL